MTTVNDSNFIDGCKYFAGIYLTIRKRLNSPFNLHNTIYTMDNIQYGIQLLKSDSRAKNKPVIAAIKLANVKIIKSNNAYKAEIRAWFRAVYPKFVYPEPKKIRYRSH